MNDIKLTTPNYTKKLKERKAHVRHSKRFCLYKVLLFLEGGLYSQTKLVMF